MTKLQQSVAYIPMLIIYLGTGSFQACTSLSQITFVNGLTLIGSSMFVMLDSNGNGIPTALTSITIPSTITTIG